MLIATGPIWLREGAFRLANHQVAQHVEPPAGAGHTVARLGIKNGYGVPIQAILPGFPPSTAQMAVSASRGHRSSGPLSVNQQLS